MQFYCIRPKSNFFAKWVYCLYPSFKESYLCQCFRVYVSIEAIESNSDRKIALKIQLFQRNNFLIVLTYCDWRFIIQGLKDYDLSHVMRLWYFSSSVKLILQTHMRSQSSSGARCLIFGQTLRLLPYFMCANSEGSGETAQQPEPSLVAYVISTIISWAGSFTVCILKHRMKPIIPILLTVVGRWPALSHFTCSVNGTQNQKSPLSWHFTNLHYNSYSLFIFVCVNVCRW